MENIIRFSKELDSLDYEIIEVLAGLKQVCLLIKFKHLGTETLALYRPESTLKISVDPSIPKPRELYLDCAFSEQCSYLGWNQFLPVLPWAIDDTDKGVVRPYYRNVKQLNIYQFRRSYLLSQNPFFWKTIAVADYVFGVGDRVSNDFLITEDGTKVVDSGFSFINRLNLDPNLSIIRKNLEGEPIQTDHNLLNLLSTIPSNISSSLYLTEENKYWVSKRVENLLNKQAII